MVITSRISNSSEKRKKIKKEISLFLMFFDMSITKRYFIGIFQKKILQTAF